MDVFDLVAKISLDKSDYEQGLNDASEKSSSLASKLGGGLKTAGKVATATLATVATAVGTVTTMTAKGVAETASYGDNVDKMSQKIGISAQAYQEWDFIAQHCGASVDGLQTSMKTMSKAVESGSDAFKKIGLNVDDLKGKTQEEIFSKVITQLQGMEAGTERTALASELLGKSATELGALLNMTASDTESMRQQAHDLGAVMSDEAIKASANYADSLQNLQTSITGLKNGAFAEFLPAVVNVMDGLTAIFSGDKSGIGKIKEGITQFADQLTQMLPEFFSFASDIIQTLIQAITENLPQLVDSSTEIIIQLFDGIIENLPQLAEASIQIIETLAEGLTNALPELLPKVADILMQIVDVLVKNLPTLIVGLVQLVQGVVIALPDIILSLIDALPTVIEDLINGLMGCLPQLIEGNVQLILALASKLPEICMALIEALPQVMILLVKAVIECVPLFLDAGVQIVNGLWDGIKNSWSGLASRVKDLGKSLVSGFKSVLGIHSPSKVFAQIGEYCTEGFNEGLEEMGDASNVADKLKAGLGSLDTTISANVTGAQNENTETGVMVNVTLAGDADGLFKVIRQESNKYYRATGKGAFAY